MARSRLSCLAGVAALFCTAWLAGCAASLGPGFVVQQQQIRVDFNTEPRAAIRVAVEYRLRNTGNQPLDSLDVRLPGRRFRPTSLEMHWDGAPPNTNASPENPRDTELRFSELWKKGDEHTLKLSYEISSASANEDLIGFTADAFYLPAGGWTPQLPQARGLFGFGGVPPKQWQLIVSVPRNFAIHASGTNRKRSVKNNFAEYQFTQNTEDLNPFVIAGNFVESRQVLAGDQEIKIWTRAKLDPEQLRLSGEALSRTIATYDKVFGGPGKSRRTLWIVECPAPAGCISQRETSYAGLLYGQERPRSAEMVSQDSVVVEPNTSDASLEASAGPALAGAWLGYGQNPGFYEQQPPVSALPAFAVALAREASGPGARAEIMRRALAAVPDPAPPASNSDPAVIRAKSLLLFFALRDQVGTDVFQRALQHMLYARRSRGFNVNDLIAAIEEEARQPVGPFVRQWIKRLGIPREFRDRYSQSASTQLLFPEETTR